MIAKLIIGFLLLCFVGVIMVIVMIGKWSEEAMDRIMEQEEIKRQNSNNK